MNAYLATNSGQGVLIAIGVRLGERQPQILGDDVRIHALGRQAEPIDIHRPRHLLVCDLGRTVLRDLNVRQCLPG